MRCSRRYSIIAVDRVAIYARVSTHDQQTLPMQLEAMRAYVLALRMRLTRALARKRGTTAITDQRACSIAT